MLRTTFRKLEMLHDSTSFESAYNGGSTERAQGNLDEGKASKNSKRNDQRTIVVSIVSTNIMTYNNTMDML